MRVLSGVEHTLGMYYLGEAAKVARNATCQRAKCGAVIVEPRGGIVGVGFNSPPGCLESQRRCLLEKPSYHPKVTDKTCCVHAEQRAIDDALKHASHNLAGSRLYFARLDVRGEVEIAGPPYCTICSKRTLDVGIAEFALLQMEGITVYGAEEYNDLSFDYRG